MFIRNIIVGMIILPLLVLIAGLIVAWPLLITYIFIPNLWQWGMVLQIMWFLGLVYCMFSGGQNE